MHPRYLEFNVELFMEILLFNQGNMQLPLLFFMLPLVGIGLCMLHKDLAQLADSIKFPESM